MPTTEDTPYPRPARSAPTESAMPPNGPPAPVRVDREQLEMALRPLLAAVLQVADAANRAASALERFNEQTARQANRR